MIEKAKFIILVVLIFYFRTDTIAQSSVEYEVCGIDFSPLYLRSDLPGNAIYTESTATPKERAWDVISRLSFEEKLELTGGWNYMYFPGVPRLGLRPVFFKDASQGVWESEYGMDLSCIQIEKSTSFPSTLALAATWNTDLAYSYAKSIGEECQAIGISVLLGPGLNMYRTSLGGRNYEYMGEDPFLTSKMGEMYVKGMQSTGTLATIKHFIGNDQEFARHVVDVKMDERALREIYLPPFLKAINEGGAMAVMAGNNFINGLPGSANKPMVEDILRTEYGFDGIFMSDWSNSMFWKEDQNLIPGSGQSLLMSNNKLFANYVLNLVENYPKKRGGIEKEIEKMIYYNLYTFFKMGFYDLPYRNPDLMNQIEKHKKVALRTAEEAITLLKNDGDILPINPAKVKKIVVLGSKDALSAYKGTGSGQVRGYDQTDYVTGLKNIYGDKILSGKGISDADIKSANIVIYFAYKKSGEGYDVPFEKPEMEEEINHYAQLNKNLVVVFSGGNGFSMPWLSKTKGLIFSYLLGQESGNALANIISGKVNPSGKLPFTIEKRLKDSPSDDYNKMKDGKTYWGGHGGDGRKYRELFGNVEISYKEGIYVGYRWYERQKIQPQFPFGFGLSYTDFQISEIDVSGHQMKKDGSIDLNFEIRNTGKVDGAEIVQLYISELNPKVDRPEKELKAFKKITLRTGESKKVTIKISAQDLSFWNPEKKEWDIDKGEYILKIGTSSKDIQKEIKIFY